ncbi:hypothetical protein MAR_015357 [Mya arenaria]|uniref:Telomeric repeat-binding factor n=1 Tax=Mya arenaria TaxID=6604 RepID=A0ABY7FL28_MYAAR|nr:hypothetical protein MAR_015357 [Mya arenaria]
MAAQLKVNEWILEYYANEIFKEFNENHKLSSQTMSLVEVLIMNQSYNKKDTVNELIIFLMVLCRLSDGSDPTIVYEEHENSDDGSEISLSSCTPLEDLISHWKALVNMQVDEDIVAEGNELTHIIQLESVLVCLRIDEQDRAKAVFDRQFGTVDESNKAAEEALNSLDKHAEKAGPSGRSRQENRVDRHLSEHLNSSNELEDEFNRISTLSTTSRGRKKWTDEEMEEFYDATVMLGVGKWAQIKEYMGTERTGVMLKDKWRNMVKNGDIERFAKVKKRK